ncbi:MAG: phosphate ABC transporter ATP-binding protein PstB [Chloroflexota bacterium]
MIAQMEAPGRPRAMYVDRLNAYYGAKHAIKDVTLHLEPQAVTAIIGPSGCGKSTLLRCLNRLHEVIPGARVGGKVLLDGENIYASEADPVRVRRRVGMVFQRPNPFPTMSIQKNVMSGLRLTARLRGVALREIMESSLRDAALWDEVKDRLKAPATSLSGGQQQRLCIARALAVQPEVLLMDEPCSALDPIATLKVEELIAELRGHYIIVIVTHNMQQASRVSDHTAFMMVDMDDRAGILVEDGPTKLMFSKPKDKRTEDYVTGRFG